MRRIARALLQSLAALAVTVALLGVLELACALYLGTVNPRPLPRSPGYDSVARAMRFIRSNQAPMVQDLDLLWRNEAGATRTQLIYPRALGRADTWTVAINSEGFRGPERLRGGTARETYRVLCIGDSVTFGYNVDQDAPFPRRLEDTLRQRYPGRPIEVINAGVPGWSWVQGLRFLEREGLALRPNLVVAAHGTNDQFWGAGVTDSEHIWLLTNSVLRSLQAAAGLLQRTATYRALVRAMPPAQETRPSPGCAAQMRSSDGCHRVSLEEIEGSVRDMRCLTETVGVDLLVMNLDFLETAAASAVRRAVWRDKTPFVDQVARFGQLYLAEQISRSWDLGVAPPHVPTIRLRAANPKRPPRTQRVLLRVLVASPGSDVTVRGAVAADEDTIDQRMYDDGTHGDELAGDAVFSTTVHLPDAARVFRYRFYLDGAAEFEPAPSYPPTWTNRVLKLADDAVAPVDLFGERFLMADNAHPNALGQQVIATSLAAELERIASLRDFVQSSDAAGDASAAPAAATPLPVSDGDPPAAATTPSGGPGGP